MFRLIDIIIAIIAFVMAQNIGASLDASLVFAAIVFFAERYDSINRGN